MRHPKVFKKLCGTDLCCQLSDKLGFVTVTHRFTITKFVCSVIFGSFQQWRLIPKLAATYALVYFARTFYMNFVELQVGMMMGAKGEEQVSFWRITY